MGSLQNGGFGTNEHLTGFGGTLVEGFFRFFGFLSRSVLGFLALIYRLRAFLGRPLPLNLDHGNRANLDLDQTFEVVKKIT